MFLEFVAKKERDRLAFNVVTTQAYQTVRIHWMTRAKKGRMPRYESLLMEPETGDGERRVTRATLHLLAARYGGRVSLRKERAQ